MNTERLRRVRELFERSADLSPTERSLMLETECAGDRQLFAEVEALLEADREAPEAFLVRSAATPAGAWLAPGDTLGNYTILERLGEGGMGTVYRARQAAPQREVALKVIRPERFSASALRRFRHESEVLGSLQHPGIAQVYEAGSAVVARRGGESFEQPYLALELVRGAPLLDHVNEHRLDLRARVELVARIADAMHHAHLRGVIHRDLKPANVLVAEEETASEPAATRVIGQPKILDFGIARLVKPGSDALAFANETGQTRETRAGDLLGTLSSMSPEQVAGRSSDVDLRSDVWALGVLLYEVLAGRPPFDLAGTTIPQAVQLILNQTPRPLGALDPALRGDLSVIASKALEKEKERRYQSAAELAADLRRYLSGEPIQARADSALYLLRRRLRRHRALLQTVLVALALLATLAVILYLKVRENQQLAASEAAARERTEQELVRSNVERGRLYSSTGHPLGEELLWREFLENPSSPPCFWGVWEHSFKNQCLASCDTGTHDIVEVILGPDELWVATGATDGRLCIFALDGLEKQAVIDVGAGVYDLDLAPDGMTIAAGCADGAVRIFEPLSGVRVRELAGHQGIVRAAFHPGGEHLASAGADGITRLWNVATGRCEHVSQPRKPCSSLLFSPDGEEVAVGSQGFVFLDSGRDLTPRLELEHPGAVYSLVFADRGRTLFSGTNERTIRAWHVETGDLAAELQPHNGTISRLWISPDEAALFALGTWRIDRFELPELRQTLFLPDTEIYMGSAPSSDGRFLVTAGVRDIRLWDFAAAAGCLRLAGHEGRVAAVLSSDGTRIATGDSRGTVRLWDTANGRLLAEWSEHRERVRSLVFSPDGHLLASGSIDGMLCVREPTTGEVRFVVQGVNPATRQSIDFSPDGYLLAAAWGGPAFAILRVEDGSRLAEIPCNGTEALSVRFAPAGNALAVSSRVKIQGALELWTPEGQWLGTFEPPEPPVTSWTIDFRGDGAKLAAGGWDLKFHVWDVETLTHEKEFAGHQGTVWDVRFTLGKSDLLVSAGADGKIKVWSLFEERDIATIDAFPSDALTVDVTPDGLTLVAAGASSDVLVWDLSYWERHMAGNLRFELERFRAELGSSLDEPRLLGWADEVLARPWPRWSK